MKIQIESSGGIGNIRIKGELKFESLNPELQQKIISLLDHWDADKPEKNINPNFSDGIAYKLSVIPDNDVANVRQIQLDEAIHDREIMRIGKDILREVIKQKAK